CPGRGKKADSCSYLAGSRIMSSLHLLSIGEVRMAVAHQRKRIFISYKRDVTNDETVAFQVYEALSKHHEVFIDRKMLPGENWPERIEAELRQADFLIAILSAEALRSEMVQAEIETAHRLAKEQAGRPIILPVRLAYRTPFTYPLSAYLHQINYAFW